MRSRLPRGSRSSAALGALGVAALAAMGVAPPAALAAAPRAHLPKIEHATDLSTEPVVRATKGKAPKKLLVKDLVKGTGAAVTATSTVTVKYVGANYKTGKDFTQATWTSNQTTTFPLDGVIPGFAEGLVGMKVGGRREIVIPPRLGYGDKSTGPIKKNETLVFVVDLVGVSG